MKAFLLLVMLACAMLWHPATVLLAALFVYATHRKPRQAPRATLVQQVEAAG